MCTCLPFAANMEGNCLAALQSSKTKRPQTKTAPVQNGPSQNGPKKVINTVDVLLKSYAAEKSNNLMSDGNVVRIQFNFKKVPKLTARKSIRMKLPHSVRKPGEEVCLFVKDLDRNSREFELTEDHFKELLQSKGVECISQIIPLKALKLEYKPYEAKRNLSQMFDLYLADERIVRLLPPLLGKSFYSRKRDPMQVNLQARNLKSEIEKVVSSSLCIIRGRGASNAVTVGHTGMTAKDLTENIMEALNILSSKSPGGAANIKSLYLRTGGGAISLPLYVSFDSGEDVELPPPKRRGLDIQVDELTTLPSGKVLVTSQGDVEVVQSDDDVEKVLKTMRTKKAQSSILGRKRKLKKKMEEKTKKRKVKTEKRIGKAKKTEGKMEKNEGKTNNKATNLKKDTVKDKKQRAKKKTT